MRLDEEQLGLGGAESCHTVLRHCPQIVKAALDTALSKKDVTTLNSASEL